MCVWLKVGDYRRFSQRALAENAEKKGFVEIVWMIAKLPPWEILGGGSVGCGRILFGGG